MLQKDLRDRLEAAESQLRSIEAPDLKRLEQLIQENEQLKKENMEGKLEIQKLKADLRDIVMSSEVIDLEMHALQLGEKLDAAKLGASELKRIVQTDLILYKDLERNGSLWKDLLNIDVASLTTSPNDDGNVGTNSLLTAKDTCIIDPTQ